MSKMETYTTVLFVLVTFLGQVYGGILFHKNNPKVVIPAPRPLVIACPRTGPQHIKVRTGHVGRPTILLKGAERRQYSDHYGQYPNNFIDDFDSSSFSSDDVSYITPGMHNNYFPSSEYSYENHYVPHHHHRHQAIVTQLSGSNYQAHY